MNSSTSRGRILTQMSDPSTGRRGKHSKQKNQRCKGPVAVKRGKGQWLQPLHLERDKGGAHRAGFEKVCTGKRAPWRSRRTWGSGSGGLYLRSWVLGGALRQGLCQHGQCGLPLWCKSLPPRRGEACPWHATAARVSQAATAAHGAQAGQGRGRATVRQRQPVAHTLAGTSAASRPCQAN